jgi:hypothetical protein
MHKFCLPTLVITYILKQFYQLRGNGAAIAYKCEVVSDSETNKVHDKELGRTRKMPKQRSCMDTLKIRALCV